MKLRQHQFSTQVQTSELKKPNPPTKKDIAKARFKDKTYHAPGMFVSKRREHQYQEPIDKVAYRVCDKESYLKKMGYKKIN